MKFLGDIGIDMQLLVAQLINFGLLLWLLSKLVYRPIIRQIEKDEKELSQAKAKTAELEHEKKVFADQKQVEVAEAKKRAGEIIKEAEDMAENIKKRVQEETEREKRAVMRQIKSHLTNIEDEK